ncbi:MAG: hypothetical protein ACFFCS_29395 [Candidatus Hodarchaeota archaeon]
MCKDILYWMVEEFFKKDDIKKISKLWKRCRPIYWKLYWFLFVGIFCLIGLSILIWFQITPQYIFTIHNSVIYGGQTIDSPSIFRDAMISRTIWVFIITLSAILLVGRKIDKEIDKDRKSTPLMIFAYIASTWGFPITFIIFSWGGINDYPNPIISFTQLFTSSMILHCFTSLCYLVIIIYFPASEGNLFYDLVQLERYIHKGNIRLISKWTFNSLRDYDSLLRSRFKTKIANLPSTLEALLGLFLEEQRNKHINGFQLIDQEIFIKFLNFNKRRTDFFNAITVFFNNRVPNIRYTSEFNLKNRIIYKILLLIILPILLGILINVFTNFLTSIFTLPINP